MIGAGRQYEWSFALLVCGTGAAVGLLAGIDPKLAIAASLCLLFMLVILSDLTAGLTLFTFLSLVAIVPIGAGPAVSFLKAIGLLLLLSWVATLIRADPGEEPVPDFIAAHQGLGYIVLLFLGWVALSQIWAESSPATLTSLYRLALNAALFLIVFTAVRNLRDLIWVMTAFVLGATVAGLYGLANQESSSGVERIAGTLGNANELAAVLVVGVVLGLGLMLARRDQPGMRLLSGACAAICLLGVLLTVSRTGVVALAVAGIATIVFAGRWRARIVPLVLVALLVGVGYFAVVATPEARERITHTGGGTGRVDLWTVGWRMVDAHPLNGIGAGNFPITSPQYLVQPGSLERSDLILSEPKVAHNTYLEVLAELGIVGFGLFMAMLVICVGFAWRAIRNFKLSGDAMAEILSRALLIALLALLAADFFVSEQFQKALWLLLALCPAVLAISVRRVGEIAK
jgi:O-antigen ligase